MAPAPQAWKQLKRFEQRGDLKKQAEILKQVLGAQLPAQAIRESLKIAWERAEIELQRHPKDLYRVEMSPPKLQLCSAADESLRKEVSLPRENSAEAAESLNWSPQGQIDVQVLQIKDAQLRSIDSIEKLQGNARGLLMNSSFAYLNLPSKIMNMSYFARSLFHRSMPLEPVQSLPYDLYLNPRHPFDVVADRGAGKLHLYQREGLRLHRSWPIVNPPNKKALSVAFHPDGKRIYVSACQNGLLVMIDRGMAQKKLPLPKSHVISTLAVANKGDILYALVYDPQTRRPDLWLLDTQKYTRQSVISLEGEAFAAGADARDLMAMTPDGQYMVVMVSKNQPALFTPCLLLVELASGQIVDQLLLKSNEKPVNLVFPARKLVNPRIRLLPLLLHGGYGLSETAVQEAFGIQSLD